MMMRVARSREAFAMMGLAVGCVFLFSLSFFSEVSARPFRLGKVRAKYGCATCHFDPKGGGKRNPFGSDYESIAIPAGEKVTDELKAKDSDGDGYTNEQELKGGSNPGNPNSTP
jgi:hypothetical protein